MRVVTILFLTLVLIGCTTTPATPMISLSALQPLPAVQEQPIVPLRVSVAAVTSPRGTVESYQPLLAYLSDRLGRPVELVQRRTYAETNDLIERGQVDLAFVCTSAYIAGHAQFHMELLAAPQVHDATVYHSLLIVQADGSIRRFAELRGKVFAFTDPMSYSGRIYPTALVQQEGSTPDQFFSHTFYTYNHDNAIRAVADGVADGAAVDSLVYDNAVARDPALAQQVRIIYRSPPFGIPPVVVSPSARPQLKAALQNLLISMADDAEGRHALEVLGADRFVRIDDQAYDSARDLMRTVGPLTP